MNYEEATEYIKTLYNEKRIILGLERVRTLMSLVGDPQDDYPSAIITGTNGKGSTSLYLSSILKEAGFKVGTNLSPHVEEITERFLVDLEKISKEKFACLTGVFKDAIENQWPLSIERPTFHELMTAMAFLLFNDENVDFAVMEVGMGGRYDACNIVNNKLSVFTPIHYDHCRYLGNTLQSIANEKAQIMKNGGVAVSSPQSPQVKMVLNEVAAKKGVHLQYLDIRRFDRLESHLLEPVRFKYKFKEGDEDDISLNMIGDYQVFNASLAILAAEKLSEIDDLPGFASKLDKICIQQALKAVMSRHLPARLEMVGTNPALIIDGGHNEHGVRNFLNQVSKRKNGGKVILVMGFKEGKNYFNVLPLLSNAVDRVIFTNFENYGGVSPSELKREFDKVNTRESMPVDVVEDPIEALDKAIVAVDDVEKDIVAVSGSLYLAGEVKNRMRLRDHTESQAFENQGQQPVLKHLM